MKENKIHYHLYVLLKDNKPLYVGVTTSISRRKAEHKIKKDFDKMINIKSYKNKKDAYIAENILIRFNGLFDLGLVNAKFDTDDIFNKFYL